MSLLHHTQKNNNKVWWKVINLEFTCCTSSARYSSTASVRHAYHEIVRGTELDRSMDLNVWSPGYLHLNVNVIVTLHKEEACGQTNRQTDRQIDGQRDTQKGFDISTQTSHAMLSLMVAKTPVSTAYQLFGFGPLRTER